MIKAKRSMVFLLLIIFIFDFSAPLFAATLALPKGYTPGATAPATGVEPGTTAKPGEKTSQPQLTVPAPVQPQTPAPATPPAEVKAPAPSPIESSFLTTEIPATLPRLLTQFGYHLFSFSPGNFGPLTDAPVGPDYVLGPGDTLILSVWGLVEMNLQVELDREGKIFLPKVGPLSLWGLTLEDAKALIQQQLSRSFTSFQISISMGSLRTIKVFVLGEAARPGAYDLSAVSTISNALFVAGGPNKIGTLRHIQHFRKNQKIGEIDFYNLLLRGDKSQDARVQAGDVVFIPTIGTTAGITGNVKRPAIYEISGNETLRDLIQLAGDITPFAYLGRVQIERVKEHKEKILIDLDIAAVSENASDEINLQDGDLVRIFAIHGRIQDAVRVEGTVRHPGDYAFKEGMRVSHLLTDQELLPESYLNRAEVVRLRSDFTPEIIPFSLQKMREGQVDQNMPLLPGDRIIVSTEFRNMQSVTFKGEFLRPGTYTITRGERLNSVIRRAGGFSPNAYLPSAVFTRKAVAELEEAELNAFMKVQEEKLLVESSALTAGGTSGSDALAEQTALTQRRELLKVLSSKVTLGRVVIHLDQPEKLEKTPNDTILEDGDTLMVSPPPSSVVVLGSVRNASAFLYRDGTNVGDYLRQAGGATKDADKKEVYLIKSDGSSLADLSLRTPVDRGDTVVVPLSSEVKYRPIPLWRDIATIIGQIAITVAAIKVVF